MTNIFSPDFKSIELDGMKVPFSKATIFKLHEPEDEDFQEEVIIEFNTHPTIVAYLDDSNTSEETMIKIELENGDTLEGKCREVGTGYYGDNVVYYCDTQNLKGCEKLQYTHFNVWNEYIGNKEDRVPSKEISILSDLDNAHSLDPKVLIDLFSTHVLRDEFNKNILHDLLSEGGNAEFKNFIIKHLSYELERIVDRLDGN